MSGYIFRRFNWEGIFRLTVEEDGADADIIENPDAFLDAEHSFLNT